MKVLTLNTHSWLEAAPLEKLEQIAQYLLKEEVDIIGLQEVNQLIESPDAIIDDYYQCAESEISMKEDNFAFLLVSRLRELGVNYYWSWVCSHIGYDRYHEGEAILSRYPIDPKGILVSNIAELTNYRRRKQLAAKITCPQGSIMVCVCHYSWWEETKDSGFAFEWQQTLEKLETQDLPTLFLGDFNSPAHLEEEGYALVTSTYQDAYVTATYKKGSFTVEETIDGWEENTEKLRIDYVFHSHDWHVLEYRVIFDGHETPIVSDHYGVLVQLNLI